MSAVDIEQRLSVLFDRISKERATKEETLEELQALKFLVSDSYRVEKLGNAIEWAEIYFSPRKWQRWKSRETVRSFLLSDLYKARIATDPRGSPGTRIGTGLTDTA